MRDSENIRAVEERIHPDMMGFIFWEGSKRYVSEVPSYLPKCTRVGVFGLNAIQLHGQETPDFCQRIKSNTGIPIIKAFSVGESDSSLFTLHSSLYEEIADFFLFDTKCKTIGGSGEQFDWDILQQYDGNTPFLLSGGIGPGDEEKIRRWRHPRWIGIDLNSRFETAPAYKDVNALAKFMELGNRD